LGYIEQNLMPGEQVILKAELHWAQFVGSAIRAGVGLLFLIASLAGSEDTRAVFSLFGWAFFCWACSMPLAPQSVTSQLSSR